MVRKSMTFEFGSIKGLDKNGLLKVINELMEDVLDMTKSDLISNIEVIPKDTGKMRETVISNINKSFYGTYKLNIFFGAPELEYTQRVEQMNTYGNPHVRHPPHNDLRSLLKGLNDSKAEGHPFKYMAELTKFRTGYNWEKAKLQKAGISF